MVLGIGSYTYQYTTLDTFGFAMKATWAEVNGLGRDLYKDPITDDGGKRSAAGRLGVVLSDDNVLELTSEQEADFDNQLRPVWRDGKFLQVHSLDQIRRRLRSGRCAW